ncbi:MAG: helicase-related protein [Paracoccaceae bacterium]
MSAPRITAVLGPTNTGKTHHAIAQMLRHRTGVIGLPLRLLAREVYERIVEQRGPSVVALVTGEERIVPPRTAFWVCTVEAMPQGIGADFVAVDEIQLCADPERGHVFTDRLLRARGLRETMFLGSETMRGAIQAKVAGCEFVTRARFSDLSWAGVKKIGRMPARSAIVGFSIEQVYATAELLRRKKGGAAVVMGALSPRTRNAQVAMYQNGDVDYLVATDAIGMGLNLDIDHVAFSSLSKFDGRRMRDLTPAEIGQIAGRAGRHTRNGSFGVTGEAEAPEEAVIDAVLNHRFAPVRKLHWRNVDLRFGTPQALIRTLERRTDDPWFTRVRESDDLAALKAMAEDAEIAARATDPASVRLLWDVAGVPDFRGISRGEHARLTGEIFRFLHQSGHVPDDWMARQVARIDRTDGDIDTLSKRLAYIRTWTYVAQRRGWVEDQDRWRDATRAVEDRLSDALHGALTQRFVDRRTSVLLRRLKQKEAVMAETTPDGTVVLDGETLGRIEGFRFRQETSSSPDEAKTVRAAALRALAPQFSLRADRFYNAPDTEMDVTEQGGLMWGTEAVGKLVKGDEPLKPRIQAFVDDDAGPEIAEKVARRLGHFVERRIKATFEPLLAMLSDEALTGAARGFAYRMGEGFGIVPRGDVAEEVRGLDQTARGALRKHHVRFGQFTIFQTPLLKPAPTRLRLVLWSIWEGLDEAPSAPPPGLVTVPAGQDGGRGMPRGAWAMSGYRAAGDRAIRIDMLERLADQLRGQDDRGGFEAVPDMLSITGLTLEQFAGLMTGLGYRAERGERPKVRAPKAAPVEGAAEAGAAPAPEGEPVAAPVKAVAELGEAAADAAAEAVTPDEGAPVASDGAEREDAADADPATADAAGSQAPGAAEVETVADAPVPAAELEGAEAAPAPAATQPEAPVETEVFYTFVRAPRGQGRGRGRQGGRPDAEGDGEGQRSRAPRRRAKGKGDGERSGKPKGDRPQGDRTQGERPQGDRGPRKGGKGKPREEGPKTYTAAPKSKAVDPDNPFAAALSGFKTD